VELGSSVGEVIDRPQKLCVPPEAAIPALLRVRLLPGVLRKLVELMGVLAHPFEGLGL